MTRRRPLARRSSVNETVGIGMRDGLLRWFRGRVPIVGPERRHAAS